MHATNACSTAFASMWLTQITDGRVLFVAIPGSPTGLVMWMHMKEVLWLLHPSVSLTPFSTALLAEFITYRLAIVVYWLNIILLGAVLFGSWRYAARSGLMKDDVTVEMRCANERRIVIGQALYAFGALLCVFNTYWSIVFIVLVQINYAIAPRIRLLYRL